MTTPAFISGSKATGSTTSATNSQTATFAASLTALSLRLCAIRLSGASDKVTAVSGSTSGAYTRLASVANVAATQRIYLYYKEGGAAGAETVTATTSNTGNSMRWGLLEYSGVLAAASPDGTPVATTYTTTTTPATSSITTTAANSLVVAFLSADTDVTTIVPGGTETSRFTDGVSGNRFEGQDFIKVTLGSTTSSWTTGASQPGLYILAAFKADTASTPAINWTQYQTVQHPLIRF